MRRYWSRSGELRLRRHALPQARPDPVPPTEDSQVECVIAGHERLDTSSCGPVRLEHPSVVRRVSLRIMGGTYYQGKTIPSGELLFYYSGGNVNIQRPSGPEYQLRQGRLRRHRCWIQHAP